MVVTQSTLSNISEQIIRNIAHQDFIFLYMNDIYNTTHAAVMKYFKADFITIKMYKFITLDTYCMYKIRIKYQMY